MEIFALYINIYLQKGQIKNQIIGIYGVFIF